ncbi:hypothetical protein SARC_02754 [Sphaeroforma arctica JP610]|uniref:Cytochrome P450 n=1 Tax=Sphaeroforma arctica JP610 TaxID=667725 RepID=A0A0L0G867_9EUKA|nr:hypothetical protein SARC_02754 [Sphaeroforma arctica JP610]KNC85061.1 hypothetical protein SARC_02754 [Sphaeroforma arctica JP610]|eukprot:XP_014158963.1 hypothetical protein SARC_02754 [Sphaeroforma arctica JP610]
MSVVQIISVFSSQTVAEIDTPAAVTEIRTILEDTPASYESVKKLTYLKAVFFETLRLYPSVPKNVRMAYADDVLPGGIQVAKGDVILYAPYVMGRDEQIWEEPLEFKPERWIDDNGKWRERSAFEFTAFNAGPRLCLGKTMAVTEALVLLATVLPLYEMTPTSTDPPIQVGETLTLPMHSHTVHVAHRADDRTHMYEE